MNRTVNEIATLMEMGIEGSMGPMDTSTDPEGGVGTNDVSMAIMPGDDDQGENCEECEHSFTAEEMAAAKDLIAMIGDADRTRELIDKVDDALEILDGGEEDDSQAIGMIAGLMPTVADMPMMSSPVDIQAMASQFRP